MKRAVLASVALVVLAGAVCVVITWRGSVARDAALRARIQQQNNGRIVDGRFSFCGETLRVDQMRSSGTGGREFATHGLHVYFKQLPSTDADQTVLSISSAEPSAKPCFDEDVQSPIAVLLTCDPAPAPVWTDFRKRSWRTQAERPELGLIALEGDQQRRLGGVSFVPMPSKIESRDGPPYQATCFSDPGVHRPAEHCKVAYRKGRVGVEYIFLTRSMRPWREVDDAVRSTLKGSPSTPRCPASSPPPV